MKYDTLYNIWLPIAPLDGPRTCMGATLYQNHIWVAGGLTKETQLPVLKSVLCYDIESNRYLRNASFEIISHSLKYIPSKFEMLKNT
jgi:hypothetical protein